MKVMFAVRFAPKGRKPSIIRLDTEEQAREWVEGYKKRGIPATYIGKVKLKPGNIGKTNGDKKKR